VPIFDPLLSVHSAFDSLSPKQSLAFILPLQGRRFSRVALRKSALATHQR
jgi:hypothetical protein